MQTPSTHIAFEINGRRFVVPVSNVVEVILAVAVTPVSSRFTLFEGVFNYRGKLTALLDIRARLGLTERPLDPDQYFLILNTREQTVALRVDTVKDMVNISAHELENGIRIPANASAPMVVKLNEQLTAICDLDGLFSDDAALQLSELEEAADRDAPC